MYVHTPMAWDISLLLNLIGTQSHYRQNNTTYVFRYYFRVLLCSDRYF